MNYNISRLSFFGAKQKYEKSINITDKDSNTANKLPNKTQNYFRLSKINKTNKIANDLKTSRLSFFGANLKYEKSTNITDKPYNTEDKPYNTEDTPYNETPNYDLFPKINSNKTTKFLNDLKIMNYNNPTPIIIGVSGESASGKTTTLKKFINHLNKNLSGTLENKNFASLIKYDNFYKDLSKDNNYKNKSTDEILNDPWFNSPKALDSDLLVEKIDKLKNKKEIKIPEYHMDGTFSRDEDKIPIKPTPVIFIDGLYTLADNKIKNKLDYKVFIDCSDEVKEQRWKERAPKRGITDKTEMDKYYNRAVEGYDPYRKDVKECADVILNNDNFDKSNTSLAFIAKTITDLVKYIIKKDSKELNKVA